MTHRRPTSRKPAAPRTRTKTNPKVPPSAAPVADRRLPERREAPPGHRESQREELPVDRPIWRDPDQLDRHPIPDEAWDVFQPDDDSELQPEAGDFWLQADEETGD